MTTDHILTSNYAEPTLSITAEAQAVKAEALATATAITTVSSTEEQVVAISAIAALKGILKTLEESRTAVKAPVLKLGKQIDEVAKQFAADIEAESKRITSLVTGFVREQEREAQRIRDEAIARERAEAQRIADEAAAEAKRLREAAAGAKSAVFAAALHKRADETELGGSQAISTADTVASRIVALPTAAPKVAGMAIRKTYKFNVVDLAQLVAARPDLCTITPKTQLINAMINNGTASIPGLEIFEETQAAVRAA